VPWVPCRAWRCLSAPAFRKRSGTGSAHRVGNPPRRAKRQRTSGGTLGRRRRGRSSRRGAEGRRVSWLGESTQAWQFGRSQARCPQSGLPCPRTHAGREQ
jgi:hypothetical protein